MAFTVTGVEPDSGIPYQVLVADDGSVTGSPRIDRLLLMAEYATDRIAATPTSADEKYDPGRPDHVLMLLTRRTRVTGTAGDVPDLTATDDDVPAGSVF